MSTFKREALNMKFTKMQGAGNDYIYVDCVCETYEMDWPAMSRRLSDRHFGVGADGLVLILPSEVADLRMRIFNADGSEAEMCGNAARCIGRYAVETGLVSKPDLTLETLGGIKTMHVAELVTVDMGTELGNPHAVFFVDEITDELVWVEGPRREVDPIYPNRSNIEFARVLSRHDVEMRVWERGSGETLACGTGACATAREAVRQGLCESPVTVHLRGGDLSIEITEDGHMLMSGPAEVVFQGTIDD